MKLKYPTRLSADMEDLQKLKNKLRRKRKLFNRMDALINNCLIKPLFKGNKLEKLSFQEVADLSSKMLHLYTKIRNQKVGVGLVYLTCIGISVAS